MNWRYVMIRLRFLKTVHDEDAPCKEITQLLQNSFRGAGLNRPAQPRHCKKVLLRRMRIDSVAA